MAVNNFLLLQRLKVFRRMVAGNRELMVVYARDLVGEDPDLRAAMLPHVQGFVDRVNESLAALTAAIQAISPTNAEKVAFANAELAKEE